MKLLLDQHLSPRLREALQDMYPQPLHVRDAGLESATDAAIWEYAKERGLVIVSKDTDFRHLSPATTGIAGVPIRDRSLARLAARSTSWTPTPHETSTTK